MDIPAHILDAVSLSEPAPSPALVAFNTIQPKKSFLNHPLSGLPNLRVDANVSLEDTSSSSESDHERDYQTDMTSPAASEKYGEDTQPGDVEEFRDREYPQLQGKTYLDHGGTTLYAKSMIEEFSNDMISNLYGNPHSASTPSAVAGHRVDMIRERALRFFNADPEEFDLIFVLNATAAIKLVIDCFKDHAAASNTPVWYGYHRDAHTSLVGIRESTKLHRCFTSDEEVDIWINSGGLGGPRARQLGLFAYPGQSNMTGRRLPQSWPGRIRKTFHKAATYSLLDAAALASTAPLDLSNPATAPDFVAVSFYKIFGFPNIGGLIVRKDSAHVLESRKYFGGGTVEMVIAIQDTWHAKKNTSLHDRLEDGTLPFHSIFALDHAMNVHERLYGPNPMKFISHHTAQLGSQLYTGLSGMKHSNGAPVCRIYKDENAIYGDPTMQGATIAFNVLRPNGSLVPFEEVEEAADERQIYVRSGSLCNPGGVATYLDWSPAEMKAAYAAGHRCSHPIQVVLGKATGVVRVSLGAMSVASDVRTMIAFLEEVYVDSAEDQPSSPMSLSTALNLSSLPEPELALTSALTSLPGFNQPPPGTSNSGKSSDFSRGLDSGNGRLSVNGSNTAPVSPSLPATVPEHGSSFPNPSLISPALNATPARPKNPPFIPADYVKMRKPWEEEMRRQAAQLGMEIKIREFDSSTVGPMTTTAGTISGHYTGNNAPSVRARRFGRSVVNLLRTNKPTMSHEAPT